MIEVSITEGMLLEAHRMSKEMGRLNNSITKGQGNLCGFLGEIIYNHVVKGDHSNTYDYDLVLDDGTTVDVKTKRTTVTPRPHYMCSVAKQNTRQKCDVYGFARVHTDLSKGWVLGFMPKAEYFEKATEFKKGEVDKSNGFRIKANCFDLLVNELYPVKDTLNVHQQE